MQFGLFDDKPKYFASFEDLIGEMVEMTDDPLYPGGTTMVIYRGNPEADIMIIGEAPGPRENEIGKPFVGPAGQLLDKILAAVDLDAEEDVFITNAVFRMPPGEDKSFRKPTTDEIDYYKPYILELIRLVDPMVMMLSGNVATQSLLGKTGITKLRGEWHQWHGRWVLPIFHPAYLLRNPSRKPGSPKALMWEDVQEVRRKYDELMSRE